MSGEVELQRADLLQTFIERQAGLIDYATRILHNRQQAEDVVQDAVIRIYETPCSQHIQTPTSYIFRLVRNLALDRARRATRENRFIEMNNEAHDVAASCACPLEKLVHCEALRIIVEELNHIPDRTRKAFLLHRLCGVTQKKLAQELGVSRTLVNFMIRDADIVCHGALERQRKLQSSPKQTLAT